MDWHSAIRGFKQYLQLEKSLSPNSVEAYIRDVEKLEQYLELSGLKINPENITYENLLGFLKWVAEAGLIASTQSRIVSGLRGFYHYLALEDMIKKDPTEFLELPRLGRKLPEFLSNAEIDTILSVIDLSKPGGERNKAMIETLYSCGLRVSELIGLKLSNIYRSEGFIKVTGKGNKERLVPIGDEALAQVDRYTQEVRV
ncbi:MAG: site-specific integrase, partial [Bacteroidia bacterium]|nr:site-specific integrase [Bacteroidia bacterium]